MYKLVALDLDGTLLNPNKEISTYNMRVLKRLQELDVKVVLATGRTFTAAYHYYLELGLDTPMISCNGGFIYNPMDEEIIFGNSINVESLGKIISFLDDLDVYYQYYSAQKVYTKRIAFLTEEWTVKNGSLPPEARINIEVIKNPWMEIQKRKEPIYKVLLTDPDGEVRNMVLNHFASDKALEFVISVGNSLDIMASGVTKGQALEKLSEYYGLSMEKVISIGDNHNDITMIQRAGCGIAMENSEKLIKDSADCIALSNDEDGVGRILNEIFDLKIPILQ